MHALTRKTLRSYNIYLASASPRRAALIRKIPWLDATVFPSNAVEPPFDGSDPAEYAMTLAEMKARDVLAKTGGTVVAADTVVTLDGKVFGKPKDGAQAESMFRLLCGRTHEVITGYCVADSEKILSNFEKTYVTFGAFVDEIVYNYIRSGAPFDKAGGYGIQDAALASVICEVRGDRDNVVGLPVKALEKTLKEFLVSGSH